MFYILLSAALVLFFIIPVKFRQHILLLLSYLIYGTLNPIFPLALFTVTAVTLLAAHIVHKYHKRSHLIAGITVLIAILVFFRYAHFMISPDSKFNILLPVGLSFYLLKAVSYLIDIYKGKIPLEKNPVIAALYLAFLPQLLSGPIDRPGLLIPQLKRDLEFNYAFARDGLIRIAWGLFKKIVIADRLAAVIAPVFNDPQSYYGIHLFAAVLIFSVQIYLDFAAYSDIAIGAARVMGIESTENFNLPYISRSVREFWRRWHISFSSWLKDYVYIPLGGSRVPLEHQAINIIITFAISGLWHGVGWGFLIWGLLHGMYLVIELIFRTYDATQKQNQYWLKVSHAWSFIQLPVTFSAITFAWIFFRAGSLNNAFYISTHLFDNLFYPVKLFFTGQFIDLGYYLSLEEIGLTSQSAIVLCLSVLMYLALGYFIKNSRSNIMANRSVLSRWLVYYAMVCMICFVYFMYSVSQKIVFIYNRF